MIVKDKSGNLLKTDNPELSWIWKNSDGYQEVSEVKKASSKKVKASEVKKE
jgi:hypothetical protein